MSGLNERRKESERSTSKSLEMVRRYGDDEKFIR